MLEASLFFNIGEFSHSALFSDTGPVWSALQGLKTYMNNYTYPAVLTAAKVTDGVPLRESMVLHNNRLFSASDCTIEYGDPCKGGLIISQNGTRLNDATLIMAGAILVGNRIALGQGVLVEGGATIKEPAIIGNCTEVRQGAYMRGYCLIGNRCVVGHTTEVKHSIFLNDAKAGHFAYLGDSILGNNVNLGAGTKFANLKFTPGTITLYLGSEMHDSGMRKFGAILGDDAQTGCNSVTNPGTVIGKKGILMPNTTAPPGYHKKRKIIRNSRPK